jgi:hypothetical protein
MKLYLQFIYNSKHQSQKGVYKNKEYIWKYLSRVNLATVERDGERAKVNYTYV